MLFVLRLHLRISKHGPMIPLIPLSIIFLNFNHNEDILMKFLGNAKLTDFFNFGKTIDMNPDLRHKDFDIMLIK